MQDYWMRLGLRLAFAAATLAVAVLSLLPTQSLPPVGLSDKSQHLIAYAVLAALGCAAFPTRRAAIWLMLSLPFMGTALELAQTFVPGRYGEFVDALVGGLGAYLVLVPAYLRHSGLWTWKSRRGQGRGNAATGR